MECPYCGKEITKGYISSGDGGRVSWKNDSPFDSMVVRIPLSKMMADTDAFYCADCRKVILDVPEIKPWTDVLAEAVDDMVDAVGTVYEGGKNLLQKGKEEREEKKKREKDPWEW